MANQKQDEENPRILREAAVASSNQAVRQVLAHRLVLTVVEQGHIVEITPDGSRKVLKKLTSPRLGLAKGTVLSYR